MGLSPRVPDFNPRKNVTPRFGVDGRLKGTERAGFLGQDHMVMFQGGDYFRVWSVCLVVSTSLPFIWRNPVLLSSSCKEVVQAPQPLSPRPVCHEQHGSGHRSLCSCPEPSTLSCPLCHAPATRIASSHVCVLAPVKCW